MDKVSDETSHNETPAVRNILLVDDEAEFLATLTSSLTNAGFCVFGATSEADAFAILEKRLYEFHEPKIDFILSDLMLPDVDGKEFLNNVRRHPNFQTIPFILFSGAIDREEARRLASLDVDGILLKPFTTPTLLNEMRAAKSRREAKDLNRVLRGMKR